MHHFTTLIDANTLAEHISRDNLTLFDCRFDLGNTHWGEAEYATAHLPGALYLHLDRDLSSASSPTSGRHPLPDPATLAARLPTPHRISGAGPPITAAELTGALRVLRHSAVTGRERGAGLSS